MSDSTLGNEAHLAYHDADTTSAMTADCRAVTRNLEGRLEAAARRASAPAPSIHFDEYPREVSKREIPVSEAAQRLANALHLHLD